MLPLYASAHRSQALPTARSTTSREVSRSNRWRRTMSSSASSGTGGPAVRARSVRRRDQVRIARLGSLLLATGVWPCRLVVLVRAPRTAAVGLVADPGVMTAANQQPHAARVVDVPACRPAVGVDGSRGVLLPTRVWLQSGDPGRIALHPPDRLADREEAGPVDAGRQVDELLPHQDRSAERVHPLGGSVDLPLARSGRGADHPRVGRGDDLDPLLDGP